MGEMVMPGAVKVDFVFGNHGLVISKDTVEEVVAGSQAAAAGIKKNWSIVLIDGNELVDPNGTARTLARKQKLGEKYAVTFMKTAKEIEEDQIEADRLAKKREEDRKAAEKQAAADAAREAEEAKKKAAEQEAADARKAAYHESQKVEAYQSSAAPAVPEGVKYEHEAKEVPAELADNQVMIKYSSYAEIFSLNEKGQLTDAMIDEVYALRAVMPKCFMHLAVREFSHDEDQVFVMEDSVGVYPGLTGKMTYYLYVQQDAKEEERDMARMRKVWARANTWREGERPEGVEGCSCLYGSPCVDQYVCKDWDNRMAVAKANGMLPLAG